MKLRSDIRKLQGLKHSKRILQLFEEIILVIIILLIWYILTEKNVVNTIVLPSPKLVGMTLINKILDGSLILQIGMSVGRVLKGYFLAVVASVMLGVIIGLSEHMYRLTKLIIQIFKPIPPIAWIPLAILWMGIGEASKVFLIFLGGFFVILVNVIDAIRHIDSKLIEVASAVETPWSKYVFQLIIPGAMPGIFTGLRVGLGVCWSCVVAAELVAANSGIGYMISNARNFGRMDIVIVGMISIGVMGKIMDEIIRIIEKKVLIWKL